MTEYFYTSELGYADFAVKHGFEGVEALKHTGKWSVTRYWKEDGKAWRFPRTPHNEALMGVKEGDVIIDSNGKQRPYIYNRCNYIYAKNLETIIYRNNKPFPVWDKEEI